MSGFVRRALMVGVMAVVLSVTPWGAVPATVPRAPAEGAVVERWGPAPAAAAPRMRAVAALQVRARGQVRASRAVTAAQARAARMAAVTRFARAQVGDRYRHGATGPNVWDCSGLTRAAYRKAGIRLPHSSRQQAARARSIPRSQARAGDLVVGPGHVGVYMGGGMMVDAGNRRVGVVYRKVYRGLRIKRLG